MGEGSEPPPASEPSGEVLSDSVLAARRPVVSRCGPAGVSLGGSGGLPLGLLYRRCPEPGGRQGARGRLRVGPGRCWSSGRSGGRGVPRGGLREEEQEGGGCVCLCCGRLQAQRSLSLSTQKERSSPKTNTPDPMSRPGCRTRSCRNCVLGKLASTEA